MPSELKLVLRETPMGLPPTPKQSAQREKFTRVAREMAQEMKSTKLKGAAKVMAMNVWMSQRLKASDRP